MTVPIDTLLNVAIGQGLAIAAARDIQARKSGLVNESFGYAIGFAAACFAPLGLFFFWVYPDWSVMYQVPLTPERAAALKWLVPFLYVAACAGGYALSHHDIRRGHVGRAKALLGVTLLLEAIVCLGGAQRVLRVGTFGAFREGTARPIWSDPMAPLLVSVGALMALALAFLVTRLVARGAPGQLAKTTQ